MLEAREKRTMPEGKKLSADDMKSMASEASTSIARLETEFYEKFQARRTEATASGRPATDNSYGGDDYMVSFDDTGAKGTLAMEFGPQAQGRKDPQPADKPKPDAQGPSTPVFSGP